MKCKACGLEHRAWIRCEVAKALQDRVENAAPRELPAVPVTVSSAAKQPVEAAPIKKAREFIRRVGRPRVVQDRKAHRREYMKKYRQKKREGK